MRRWRPSGLHMGDEDLAYSGSGSGGVERLGLGIGG